jgi:hypothetical protein
MPKELKQVDTDFFQSAPYRKVLRVSLAQPPQAVFDALAKDPAGWSSWFPGFSAGKYLTAPPQGPGSDREMVMRGMTIVESVIHWEEPTRWAFRVSKATMPGVRAFAEDYLIEPEGTGSQLTWTLALDAPKPLAAIIGAAGASGVRKAVGNLERHLGAS